MGKSEFDQVSLEMEPSTTLQWSFFERNQTVKLGLIRSNENSICYKNRFSKGKQFWKPFSIFPNQMRFMGNLKK